MGASFLRRLTTAVSALALLSACQTAREQESQAKPVVANSYLADKPAALKRHFYIRMTQGRRNQVLNDMRLGLAALEMGEDRLATELLDDALTNIETIYADNDAANAARGLFVKEAVKDFKGEPYERAMAYFYRGLLYLKQGDFDNARASFKGGLLQDAFAEEMQNRADFGLLAYLQAWASRCRGNTLTMTDDWADFRAINSDFPLPSEDDNTILLVETGTAPIKFSYNGRSLNTKGKLLKFRRVPHDESAHIVLGPEDGRVSPPLPVLGDVYHQAATRGGREFDAILGNKVAFKQAADKIGDGALTAATLTTLYGLESQDPEQQQAAALATGVLLTVSLLAKLAEYATEAESDTRYWDNLPDRVHAISLPLPESISAIAVEFRDQDGAVLRTRQAPIWRAGPCNLAWVRSYSAYPYNPRAPYSAPTETMMEPVVIPSQTDSNSQPIRGDHAS